MLLFLRQPLKRRESGDAGHDDDNQDASSECSEQFATTNGKAKKAAPAAAEGALSYVLVQCQAFSSSTDEKKRWLCQQRLLQSRLPKIMAKADIVIKMSALSLVGEDYYVVFPLKGILLNVREASPKQLQENAEIQNIKNNVGLQYGKEYDKDAQEEPLSELKAIEHGKILARYASNDPTKFEAMKEAIKVAHEAANRWTVCTYCCEMISGFSINMDEHAPFAPLATLPVSFCSSI
ncbi:hypothetical protein L2E82_19460 [Cichorium intybus]|uniref:Uncharacterized protein n=1 Tax=Cichorium intybus TaxID=13427 RepID=A0ACB9FBW3_CICIN|nr:hypothetical protein L2E82_19460 [Cichorium intybus]